MLAQFYTFIYYYLFIFKYTKFFVILGSKEEEKPHNNEVKMQETQGSKRPLPHSFSQTDEYYDQFCKPSLYFPSLQKYVIM